MNSPTLAQETAPRLLRDFLRQLVFWQGARVSGERLCFAEHNCSFAAELMHTTPDARSHCESISASDSIVTFTTKARRGRVWKPLHLVDTALAPVDVACLQHLSDSPLWEGSFNKLWETKGSKPGEHFTLRLIEECTQTRVRLIAQSNVMDRPEIWISHLNAGDRHCGFVVIVHSFDQPVQAQNVASLFDELERDLSITRFVGSSKHQELLTPTEARKRRDHSVDLIASCLPIGSVANEYCPDDDDTFGGNVSYRKLVALLLGQALASGFRQHDDGTSEDLVQSKREFEATVDGFGLISSRRLMDFLLGKSVADLN